MQQIPLLTMAAPFVVGFISKHVSNTGMNMNGLASLLQREAPTFRSALPPGLSELFWPARAGATSAPPVIAQTVRRERPLNWLLPALVAAALLLGFGWLFSHVRRPAVPRVTSIPTTGEANRFGTPTTSKVTCTLPAGVSLPQGGTESRLLMVVQNPSARLDQDNWLNADHLSFDSGSAKLNPGSDAELNNLAAILKSCPNVHITVAGHTDSLGNPEANLRLSQNRANTVVGQLVSRGVSPDCLVAEGLSNQNPVGDDATAEGRAQNRRVAILVTQR